MTHAHYWLIDPPDGATSKAHCKICGETKEFWNYWLLAVKNPMTYPTNSKQEVEVGRHESIYQILGV